VESKQRQLLLLGAILVLLVVVVRWQMGRPIGPPPGGAVPTRAAQLPPPAARGAAGSVPRGVPDVRLADLTRAQPEPADTGRDPFRFGAVPVRRVEVPTPGPAGGRSGAAPGGLPPSPAPPSGPPPPPAITLKFIGFVRQADAATLVVLRDDLGVYYGAEGDIIEGRYRILRVTADSVDVAYTDGRGRQVLRLQSK
jgi:hypothetical protein